MSKRISTSEIELPNFQNRILLFLFEFQYVPTTNMNTVVPTGAGMLVGAPEFIKSVVTTVFVVRFIVAFCKLYESTDALTLLFALELGETNKGETKSPTMFRNIG